MSDWKYTIPVMRAEERSDGLYLVGEAAGPEVAADKLALTPPCVANLHEQIVSRADAGTPFVYRDNHGRGSAAMADLGWIVDGEVNPLNYHLKVEVKLDEDNPAAVFTHRQVKRGKQFGMSIQGSGTEWHEDNGRVLIDRVELNEISHTTAPSWVPSFGTVIARSLDNQGVQNNMSSPAESLAVAASESTGTPAPEITAPAEAAPETQVVERTEDAPVEEAATLEPVQTETAEPVVAPVVERARLSKADMTTVRTAFATLATTLGVDLAEVLAAEATTQTETPVAASETPVVERAADTGDEAPADDLVEIEGVKVERSVGELFNKLVVKLGEKDSLIEQLMNMPAGQVPAAVVRSKFNDDKEDALKDMTPEEKLRFALHGLGYSN